SNGLRFCSVGAFPLEMNWQHYNRQDGQDGSTAHESGNTYRALPMTRLALPMSRLVFRTQAQPEHLGDVSNFSPSLYHVAAAGIAADYFLFRCRGFSKNPLK